MCGGVGETDIRENIAARPRQPGAAIRPHVLFAVGSAVIGQLVCRNNVIAARRAISDSAIRHFVLGRWITLSAHPPLRAALTSRTFAAVRFPAKIRGASDDMPVVPRSRTKFLAENSRISAFSVLSLFHAESPRLVR